MKVYHVNTTALLPTNRNKITTNKYRRFMPADKSDKYMYSVSVEPKLIIILKRNGKQVAEWTLTANNSTQK